MPQSARNRWIGIAALAAAGVWLLLSLTDWSALADGVRLGAPSHNYGLGQPRLFSSPVQPLPVGATLLLLASAALLGYGLVVHPLWPTPVLSTTIPRVLAGVVPGMLLIAAVNRVVTLVMPHSVAAPLTLLAALAGSVLVALSRRRSNAWHGSAPQAAGASRTILLWIGLLAACLVLQMHTDRYHGMADGGMWFLQHLYLSGDVGIGTDGYLPLFNQHYDEVAFLYPITYGFVRTDSSALPTISTLYWLMLAASRLSMFCLTYVALRGLSLSRLASLVLILFIGGASLSLNPLSSRLLFDSLSPMLYVLHPARFLIPFLPLLAVSALTSVAQSGGRIGIPALVLLGVGFSSLPFHAGVALAWILLLAVVACREFAQGEERRLWLASATGSIVLVLAATVAYAFPTLDDRMQAGALLGTFVLMSIWAAVFLVRALRSSRTRGQAATIGMVILLAGAYGAGMLLLGNVLIDVAHRLLGEVWPWSGADILRRISSDAAGTTGQIAQSPFCNDYLWEYRKLAGHCGSMARFASTYGMAIAAIAAVAGWQVLRQQRFAVRPATAESRLVAASIFLCLVPIPACFFFFDFLSPSDADYEGLRRFSVWVRSRLVESWWISGLSLALVCWLRHAPPKPKGVAYALMLFATAAAALAPFSLPGQFVANIATIVLQFFKPNM